MKKIILIILTLVSFISNAQTNSAPFNLEALQKKADSGDSEALYTIGQSYLYGLNNLAKDEKKAFDYFIKSASKNNAKGQNALGVCHQYGYGTEKNLTKTIEYYTKSADNGNMKAQYNLGGMYRYGKGVNKDLAKAFSLYMLSANQDYKMAQYELGNLYLMGYGTDKNVAKAKEWFDKSVSTNDLYCLNNVASQYSVGMFGFQQDYYKAFELYSKATDLGDNNAILEIASMYTFGHGVAKNYKKAATIYQSYANEGSVNAQLKLAFLYANGDETLQQDYGKALEQYQKAASKNNSIAQAEIGFYNEYGYGIPVNNEEAMKWYRIAEANGNRGIRFKSKIFNPYYNPPPSKKECPVCHGSGIYIRIIRGESGSYRDVITPSQQLFTSDALAQMRATGATAVYSRPVYSNYSTSYSSPDQQIKETCNRCHGSGEVDE